MKTKEARDAGKGKAGDGKVGDWAPIPAKGDSGDAAAKGLGIAAAQKGSAERILDAATELLATQGYAALSMRKVAAMVGLSQAAIYRHYADKAELVDQIVEKGYGMLRQSIETEDDVGRRPEELLASGMRKYVAFAAEHASIFKAVLLQDIGPSQSKVNALTPGVARQRKTFEILVGLISRGVAEGRFAPCVPEITAQAVWAAMFGLAARVALESPNIPSTGTAESRRSPSAMEWRTMGMQGLVIERQIEIILGGLRPAKESS